MVAGAPVYAQDRAVVYSPYLAGSLGLNLVPNARMDEVGTVRLNTSTLDPYVNVSLGVQVIDPLHVSVRQTAEVSNIIEDPIRLYPGIDLKLRLLNESRLSPEIAVGLQSALGHKRTAGEFLAASKRYKNFDFTGGLGWGRFGSAGHFSNPLKVLSNGHFGGRRVLDGESPNDVSDWFTGDDVGLFGGVEYFTPVKGLSIKLDYGADRFIAEQAAIDGFDEPAPWSAGLSYSFDGAVQGSAGIAVQGTDKISARLSLASNIGRWPDITAGLKSHTPLRAFRTGLAVPGEIETAAAADGTLLYDASTTTHSARANLALQPGTPTPYQIGRAAVHMANHGGTNIEELSLTPTIMGLRGRNVTVMRRDLEQAHLRDQSSSSEIWRRARFAPDPAPVPRPFYQKQKRQAETLLGSQFLHFNLDQQISLSEEDNGVLSRTSFVTGLRKVRFFGLLDQSAALRFNLHDNLDQLNDLRSQAFFPVRSDVDEFADNFVGLDQLNSSFSHSLTPDLHFISSVGYLEEFYAGLGGEILYRPFDKRYAVGAELWQSFRRDPNSLLNLNLNGDHILSGHVNGWYHLPRYDATVRASVGRYLAGDVGGDVTLTKNFKNGSKIEGFVTLTDQADLDPLGDINAAYSGVRLQVPLGGFPYILQNSTANVIFEPLGRDTGQRIRKPHALYETTSAFSKDHMAQHWDRILDKGE